MTEPHVSPQIPPSPSASPEPPRKRPRTSERELGPSPSPHHISSISSSQGEASGMSPSPATVDFSSSSHMPYTGSGSSYLGASTGRQVSATDAVRFTSGAACARAETACVTRQGGSFPDEAASDDRSGARRTPDGMKAGGLKGKGTERPSAPETQDTEMVWQPEGTFSIVCRCSGTAGSSCQCTHEAGGATSSAMAVLYPRHGEQADHGEDEDEDAPVRDGEFYIDSADCVIRVEDTLFRVSGALLSSCWFPPPAAPHSKIRTSHGATL